jgi:enamine deaminase RidA (YjgF/YER057c/UK114 family)
MRFAGKEFTLMAKSRRTFLAGAALAAPAAAQAQEKPVKKVHYRGAKPQKTPLFSSAVSYGNLLFIAGKGWHKGGDIKVQTAGVLDEIEAELKNAGSSMEKVLKCNVYLKTLEHYKPMNEVFLGRFGPEPPVRTTVAVADIPGDSLIEIDVIAFI